MPLKGRQQPVIGREPKDCSQPKVATAAYYFLPLATGRLVFIEASLVSDQTDPRVL